MPTELHPTGPGHTDAVVELLLESRRRDGTYPPPYVAQDPSAVRDWLGRWQPLWSRVAVLDGAVVGHVEVHRPAPAVARVLAATGAGADGHLEVGRLVVDPARRGTGLGRTLLRAAAAEVCARGARPVLTSVLAEPALALYRSEGWVEHPPLRTAAGLVLVPFTAPR